MTNSSTTMSNEDEVAHRKDHGSRRPLGGRSRMEGVDVRMNVNELSTEDVNVSRYRRESRRNINEAGGGEQSRQRTTGRQTSEDSNLKT